MYDLAMTIYFGMYGATMTTNSELFWGPNSIMMLPYMSSVGDAQSAFFQRMTGLGFAIMSLGYAKCGVSKEAWIKQTMIFHVVSTPIFFLQCASDDGTSFTPWVWYRALRRRGGCLHFTRHRRDAIDATPSTRRVTTVPLAVQIAINIALAAWGYTEMAKSKTK